MTITSPETSATLTNAPQLQHKSAPAADTLTVAPEGIVTALVSITGVEDEVADIIEPGAFTETLAKRRPKVVWAHSWTEPVGRVLHIEEWLPGDPRLPKETKDGKPWPAEAGALVATMQFDLRTKEGLRAFRTIEFYSESDEAEYSIGYQVPAGKATRSQAGKRRIKAIDLYEISPVLFGAAPLSMTLSLKGLDPELGDDEVAALHAAAAGEIDWDEVAAAAPADPPAGEDPAPVEDAPDLAAEPAGEEVKRRFSAEHREEAAEAGTAMGDGSFPIENAADLRNAIQALGRAKDINKAKRHIIKRARALGLVDELPEGWLKDTKAAFLEHYYLDLAELAAAQFELLLDALPLDAKAAPKDPKKKKSEDEEEKPQKSPENASFEELHPRDAAGMFAPKDSGSSSSTAPAAGPDANGDGLPDNWLQQLTDADPRYDANAAKKGKAGRDAQKKKAEREKEQARKKGEREKEETRREGEDAAARNTRDAEMRLRDRVETALDKEREAEATRRDANDAAIDKIADPKARKEAQDKEQTRRRTWDASVRRERAKERARRRAWEAQQRTATSARAKARTERKDAASDPDVDHAYWPGEDGTGCASCDFLVDAEVHCDSPESKAALRWVEEMAWLDPLLYDAKVKGGADRNRGNAEELRRWYVSGEGAAKIRWGTPGDFERCTRIAGKHMTPAQAAGFCNLRHQDAVGAPPGQGHKDGEPDEVETKLLEWSPGAEVGDAAAHLPAPEVKDIMAPAMPGTLEERRDAVASAVREALRGEADDEGRHEWDMVEVIGTWPDRVVATRRCWRDGDDRSESYEMPYRFTADGVELGEPEQVDLHVTVLPRPGEEPDTGAEWASDVSPAPGLIDDATYALKAQLGALLGATETKEGRVLSRLNLSRLRQAVTSLLAVLAAAGVEIDKPTEKRVEEEQQRGPEPVVTPDTTSEAAREAKVSLTSTQIAEGLALLVPQLARETDAARVSV